MIESIKVLQLIRKNDIDSLIKSIKNVNLKSPIHNDMYLIHYAVYLNSLPLLKAIIKVNKKLDYQTKNGMNIFHISALRGYCDIFFYLLDLEPKLMEVQDNWGNTAIHYITEYPDCLEIVLTKKLNFNIINNEGHTPFVFCLINLIDEIDFQKKERVNIQRNNFKPIIKYNFKDDHPYILSLKALSKHVNLNRPINNLPLIGLTIYRLTDLIKHIIKTNKNLDINVINRLGHNALLYAVINSDLNLVKILIDTGISINNYGALGNKYIFNEALYSPDNDLLNYFLFDLNDKINFEHVNYEHNTPAHIMFEASKEYTIEQKLKMLESTNNFNLPNLDGITLTILLSLLDINEFLKYKHVLVTKKLDIFLPSKFGKSAYDYFYKHLENGNDEDYNKYIEIIVLSIYNQLKLKDNIIPKVLKNITEYNMDTFNIIKDYMLENKISYLYSEEEKEDIDIYNAIKLPQYEYAYYNLYKNLEFDIFVMTGIIFNRNRDNLYLPVTSREDLIDVAKYKFMGTDFKSRLINNHFDFLMYYMPEMLTTDILWFNKDFNLFTDKHVTAFKNGIESDKRFIFMTLGIFLNDTTNGHANILIYDKKAKILERFDPNGFVNVQSLVEFDDFLEKQFNKIIGSKFEYISPQNYKQINSFQNISDEINDFKRKTGDVKGFCQGWVYWYLEMRILNKDIHPLKLIPKLLKKIISQDMLLIEYIRNYVNQLYSEVIDFVIEAGVPKRIVNNILYTEQHMKKVSNQLVRLVIDK